MLNVHTARKLLQLQQFFCRRIYKKPVIQIKSDDNFKIN